MYILTRYVVWEVLKYFLLTLVALTLVVTPIMGIGEGLRKGLPALVILRILPYMLPEMLGITIPASMLFAVCSVFGRMTGANEIVALKSLGISPMAVVWPAIVAASFLSLGTVWMYEIAATWCKPSVLRVASESIEEIAYSMLQKQRSYNGGQFSIVVKQIASPAKRGEPPRLIRPRITISGPQKITISAAEAMLQTDWKNRRLQIECRQANVDIEGQMSGFVREWHHSMPIVVPAPERYHRDWVAMRDIPRLIGELQATLRRLEQLRAARAALGTPESPADAAKIDNYHFQIRRLRGEPYRRWANGFACLCFALIGTPVAMFWRHADVLTNFFVCFLPILAVFYPLVLLSDHLATVPYGQMPACSFWMANLVLCVPAVALWRWIVRH